ncbi:MAG: tRNA(His) guanylyltransferase Thg1 family protein [Bacteroidales bacterium]|nr:tRNA(His) guanylyltransferase Thg1 family protein [Bacteroidales bacterium]
MRFETLQDKCDYFRSLSDYRITPNSYVILMLDGRSFSKLIKNKYRKPFDNRFIGMMNETAKYLLQNIQGAKFAYVQSDEISILVTDFDTPVTDAPFGYRLCKLQSICAAMAASKFNQLAMLNELKSRDYDNIKFDCDDTIYRVSDVYKLIETQKLVEFDCKAWSVPDYNTAFCHFLWRQNDCVRNSKQQAAQTYLSHKELIGLETDKQVTLLKEKKGIDWNTGYNDGEKYGRLIFKETRRMERDGVEYERSVWEDHFASPFSEEDNVIKTLIPKRNE